MVIANVDSNPLSLVRFLAYLFFFLFSLTTVTFAKEEGPGGNQPPSEQPSELACGTTSAINKVDGVTLLPSDSVTPGTSVTVRINGTGCCKVGIFTNGPEGIGALGDYIFENGSFPFSHTFQVEKVGIYKINITGHDIKGGFCVKNPQGMLSAILRVRYKKLDKIEKMKPKQIPPYIPKSPPKRTQLR